MSRLASEIAAELISRLSIMGNIKAVKILVHGGGENLIVNGQKTKIEECMISHQKNLVLLLA